ncbi:MAG: exopolysaccharide transport family protein [Filomicrobium sp.]
MRHKTQASPDDIDLTTIGTTLRRALPKLLALTLIAGAATYATLSTIAPQYIAQSELGIVAKGASNPFKAPGSSGSSIDLASRVDEKAVNTHVRAIQSPDLLEKIAKQMHLADRREFNPVLGPVDTFTGFKRTLGLASSQSSLSVDDRVLNAVSKRLAVYAPAESRAISINFTSIDPKLAANFANNLANAYRDRLATATIEETNSVQKKLAPRIAVLQSELTQAEAAVAKFRTKAGLLRGGSQKTPINEQQLGDITTELTKVKSLRSAAEARAKSARQLMRKGTPEVIPEVQRSPLIQNLISQRVSVERELLKRSASLKAAHPVMRQLRADLSAVNRQIAGEVANIVASLDKEAFLAAEQDEAITASMEKLKSKVADNSTDEVELRRLETVASAKRAELERLQAQFEANRAQSEDGAIPVEAQILTEARAPTSANFPRKLPYTLLVMVATLLLGTALVITGGLMRGARQSAEPHDRLRDDIAAATSAPVPEPTLNPVTPARPDLPPGLAKFGNPKVVAVDSKFTRIGTPIDLAKHLLETSRNSTAGFRSLVATSLDADTTAGIVTETANKLNQTGKQTIVLDWSLDGAGISRNIGLPNAPGFTELLKGTASFADVVCWIPNTQVHFIPSGWAFSEGPEGLDSDQLNLILDALDEAYDQIIVVGQHENARILFETIQGRFDAGILAIGNGYRNRILNDPPDTYLGFEVADIDLIRFEPTAALKPQRAAS